jgi:hypothetical protein
MMADNVIGSIAWELDLDDTKFKKGLEGASRDAKALGDSFRAAEAGSKVFAAGLAAVGAGLVAFGVKSVQAFNESEQVTTKLTKLILNQAGATMKQVDSLKAQAAAMQAVTPYGDELVMQAQAQLATFDLSTDAIQKLIPGFLDMMSVEKGTAISMETMKEEANGLGKALVGQTEMLVKQGFIFTKLQKEILKTGTEQERLQVITEVMGKTYGGLALQLRNTFQGQMQAAQNTLNDFMELVGKAITERLTPLVGALNNWMAAMGGPAGMMQRLTDLGNQWAAWLPVIIGLIIGGLTPALSAAAVSMWALFAPLAPFLAIGAAIGLIVKLLIDSFGGWGAVINKLQPAIQAFNDLWSMVIKPNLEVIWNLIQTQLVPALQGLWNTISPLLIPILKVLGTVLIGTLVVAIMAFLGALTLLVQSLATSAQSALWWVNTIVGLFSGLPGMIKTALSGLYSALTEPFTTAFDKIKQMADEVWEKLQKINPFHRESPSLVDNVMSGMDVIKGEFESLGKVNIPTASMLIAPGIGNSTNTNAFTFNVSDKVDLTTVLEQVDKHLSGKGLQANFGIS